MARVVMLLAVFGAACGDEPATMMASSPANGGGAGAAGGPSVPSGGTPIAGSTGITAGVAGSLPAAAGAAGSAMNAAGSSGTSGAAGTTAAAGGSAAGAAAAGSGVAGMNAAGSGAAGMPAAGSNEPEAGSGGTDAPADFEPCPPAGQVCKILPLGDSITFGIGYDGGYRVELFRRAHSAGKQITFTGSLSNGPSMVDGAMFPKNNEGHSGWKIAQLNPLIPNPALKDPPNIILLMIGTNDIAQNDDLPNAPKRLGTLLDLLIKQVPNALIVVAKLTPLSFGGGGGGGVKTYNDAIPAVIDERASAGKHVVLVDQFTGFPTSQLGDGVHPNQQGYERMAGVWYDAIEDVLR